MSRQGLPSRPASPVCAKLLTPAHRKGKDGAGWESDGACSAIGVLFQDCGTQFRIWRVISSLRNKTQDLFRDWHIISRLRNTVPHLAYYFEFAEQNLGIVPRYDFFYSLAENSTAYGCFFLLSRNSAAWPHSCAGSLPVASRRLAAWRQCEIAAAQRQSHKKTPGI